MNYETNRLNTFTNWPALAPVDPIRIAKAGFFYTGQGMEVQCFSCGGKISEWNYGDQVMWRHRRMEPNCTFVVNSQLSGNVPMVLGPECPSTDELARSWSTTDDQSDLVESTGDYGVTEEDEMYRSEALRLLSFSHWEDDSVSREALVSAGFYHIGGGRLRCAWCGGELAPFRRFGSLGRPLEVHRMYFPRCAHAAALESAQQPFTLPTVMSSPSDTPPIQSPPETGNDSQSQSAGAAHNERLLNMGGTWRTLGVVSGGARYPQYASLASRLATFDSWPTDKQQTPKDLSEAGFFHTGTDDQVRCFYCDGGLGKWEAGDAPWTEHARWFPHCGYVLLLKGNEFVDECRNDNNRRNNSRETGVSSRRRNPGVNYPVTEIEVEECMESPITLAALGAGLDVARVRRAILQRLRSTGTPFQTSEALIDSVLDAQLNEEAWSTNSQSQSLSRHLAETLRGMDSIPGIAPQSWDNNPDRGRSQRDGISPSLTEIESRRSTSQPRTLPPRRNVSVIDDDRTEPLHKEESLTLEEENRQLREARLCKVCMDNEVSVVFLPCGHLVSCARCGAALSACPLCRGAVRALVRAYLA